MKNPKNNAKKILVIRSGAVGDLIMSTPFLKNLRENFPDSKISFLVGKWSASVLKNNPNIDEIIDFDDEIVVRKRMLRVISLVGQLRRRRFDLCFILDKSWMWTLFGFLCGIRKRIGFSRGNEGIWNSKSVKFDGSKNEGDYNLDLIRDIGANAKEHRPEIFASKEDKEFARRFMKKIAKKGKVIGICPGGAVNVGQKALIKRWPIEKYTELTDILDYGFVIFGDESDKEIAREIIEKSRNKRVYDATGISIQKTKEIMEKCNVVVSHDSGGMHIASTTSAKLIALFGPTPAKRFAPKKAIIVQSKCTPCYTIYGRFDNKCNKECMDSIIARQIQKFI